MFKLAPTCRHWPSQVPGGLITRSCLHWHWVAAWMGMGMREAQPITDSSVLWWSKSLPSSRSLIRWESREEDEEAWVLLGGLSLHGGPFSHSPEPCLLREPFAERAVSSALCCKGSCGLFPRASHIFAQTTIPLHSHTCAYPAGAPGWDEPPKPILVIAIHKAYEHSGGVW